jgi:TonB-dependent starch-binding outer membrane protein SusC
MLLLVSCTLSAFAQNKTITGTVKDATNFGIPGASVIVKGTSKGTMTDIDGKYSITIPSSSKQFVVTFVGYEAQTVTIGNQSKIDVLLKESSVMLNEVVAIGYGKMKKKDLTGASVSLGGGDIKSVPVTTAAQAITGKLAGVTVTTTSGAPGADINIFVRGGTSITQDNAPLYVVDGFVQDDGLKSVDIADIETIDVMKDASSTAIFGARGANGVILITTKSGKKGKTQINYNGYVGSQKLGKKLDVLNPLQFASLQYERHVLDGTVKDYESVYGTYDQMNQLYANSKGIDWQDEMFGGSALSYNHNLSLSAGSDKTKFNLSYTNTTENGILDKSGYFKNNLRFKLDHEINKRVRLNMSGSFLDIKKEGGGDLGGRLKYTILSRPTGGILLTDAELLTAGISDDPITGYDKEYKIMNPIIANDATTKTSYDRRFNVNASLEVDLYKGLLFKTSGSYNWKQVRNDMFDDGRTLDASNKGGAFGSRDNSEAKSWQQNNTLTYSTEFNKLHSLTVMVGNEMIADESLSIESGSSKFPGDNFGLDKMGMGTASDLNVTSRSKNTLTSFFGRVNYGFADKYLLAATMRADGSSKFASGHKWGYFPSASFAWRIIQEDFMQDQKVFSNLKLRLGYGTSGNNRIASNLYASSYGTSYYSVNGGTVISLVPSTVMANKNLKWETNKTLNFGLDMSFLNNRLNATLDLYRNQVNDLLLSVSIPQMTGYASQMQNIGSTRIQGVELQLSSINIKKKDFTWNTDFNISFSKSKVLRLADTNYKLMDDDHFKIEVGKRMGQMYGFVYDGLYSTDDFTQNTNGSYSLKSTVASKSGVDRKTIKPGDIKFKRFGNAVDASGNPVYNNDDRTVIGNGTPDFTGGLNNTFTYKNFDFSFFLNFVVGNDIMNLSTQRFTTSYAYNENGLVDLANRFTLIDPATGLETTDLAKLTELNKNSNHWNVSKNSRNITDISSYYIEDGSFLRISNVSLGYTLPKSLMQKAHIQNCRFYATVNNLYTFTHYSGYDPEVTGTSSSVTQGVDDSSYPRARNYVFGVNLTF